MTFLVFMLMGALVGLASLLNGVRFSTVPSNAGIGLELKAIAAVVVGGTAITGGRGTLIGTLIGVALLGTIVPMIRRPYRRLRTPLVQPVERYTFLEGLIGRP